MTQSSRPGRLAAAAVVACAVSAWTPGALASDEATFVAAYKAGVAARKAAAALEFEWRDTRKLLRQAKKLAEKGKFETAVELANRAKRQGDLAVLQAREQETAWQAMVPQ